MKINSKKFFKRAMALLCVIALFLSAVLAIHSFSGRGLIGCGSGSHCNTVLSSRWSFLFGIIPTSALAMGLYSALLVILLMADSLDGEDDRRKAWSASVVGAGAIVGAAAWFIFVQMHFIGAFCPYCMSAHVCGIVFSVLLLTYVSFIQGTKHRLHLAGLFACGLALAGVLAVTQTLTTPSSAYDSGRSQNSLPDMSSWELPVVGNPDATHKLTLMYDYRCSHCRRIHHMLGEIASASDFAFVLCPVPISKECNPYISTDVDLFKGSCTLDKAALAVWRTKPEAFPLFDEWLFSSDSPGIWSPRPEEEALAMAQSLIGAEALENEMSSAWMSDYMAQSMELFGRTSSQGKGAIPRFICEDRYMVPDADDPESLMSLLKRLADGNLD